MATIEIRKSHQLGIEEARRQAEAIAARLESKLGLCWEWSGDQIAFEAKGGVAKGASGTLVVSDCEIAVNVDLPLILRPLKAMIESKIREKLDKLS